MRPTCSVTGERGTGSTAARRTHHASLSQVNSRHVFYQLLIDKVNEPALVLPSQQNARKSCGLFSRMAFGVVASWGDAMVCLWLIASMHPRSKFVSILRQQTRASNDYRDRPESAMGHGSLMSFVKHCARDMSLPRRACGSSSGDGSCRERAGPGDVGDQTLIRGCCPHFRFFVRAVPSKLGRRDQASGHIVQSGVLGPWSRPSTAAL